MRKMRGRSAQPGHLKGRYRAGQDSNNKATVGQLHRPGLAAQHEGRPLPAAVRPAAEPAARAIK